MPTTIRLLPKLVAIATCPALSELRGLRLYRQATLPDVAHETNRADPVVKYAYAATNVQCRLATENAEPPPNILK